MHIKTTVNYIFTKMNTVKKINCKKKTLTIDFFQCDSTILNDILFLNVISLKYHFTWTRLSLTKPHTFCTT